MNGFDKLKLPKDPQDRIIIATALHYQATLISFDAHFTRYQEMNDLLISENLHEPNL